MIERARFTEEADEWLAERLVCGAWVSTRNQSRREAEVKFGRHLQNDHQPDPTDTNPPA